MTDRTSFLLWEVESSRINYFQVTQVFLSRTQVSVHKGCALRNEATWQQFDAKCVCRFWRAFLKYANTSFWNMWGHSFLSMRWNIYLLGLKFLRADNQVSLTLESAGALRNNFVFIIRHSFSGWVKFSVIINMKKIYILLYANTKFKSNVLSLCTDFKGASTHLLPHIHVAGKWQILIK